MMAERIINVNDTEQIINLFGTYDENINMIQRQYDVVVLSRGTDIKISGSDENARGQSFITHDYSPNFLFVRNGIESAVCYKAPFVDHISVILGSGDTAISSAFPNALKSASAI